MNFGCVERSLVIFFSFSGAVCKFSYLGPTYLLISMTMEKWTSIVQYKVDNVMLLGFVQRVQQSTADGVIGLLQDVVEQCTAALWSGVGGAHLLPFVTGQCPAAEQLFDQPEVRFHRRYQLLFATFDALSHFVSRRKLNPLCNRSRSGVMALHGRHLESPLIFR